METTHPPLNAPIGFRTGMGTATVGVCSDLLDVRKLRAAAWTGMEWRKKARRAGEMCRDAMVSK